MAYTPHSNFQPEKVAAQGVGLLYNELLLPNLYTSTSFDEYKGARDGVVNVKVEGLLPARVYRFRNDRSAPIEYDQYSEDTIQVAFAADRPYSAVELTDEQNDFDQITVEKLMPKQAQTVGRAMERTAGNALENAEFQVTIGGAQANLYQTLVEARRLLNKFNVPGTRYLVVGTDFEASMLMDKRFTAHVSVGDNAGAIMRSGNLGNWAGFQIFVSNIIDPSAAYAFTSASFATATAAPYVPASVPFGATASYNGYALRWIRDYDAQYLIDRSVVDAYFGVAQVKDRGWVVVDEDAINATLDTKVKGGTGSNNGVIFKEKILEGEFNVRSFKITLDGASTLNESTPQHEALNEALKLTAPAIVADGA